MSEIVKTRAVVLRKLDYGESSKIATFCTEEHGKVSAIIKGAKSPKSKLGRVIDLLNHLQLVYYMKPGRELQVVTQADLIDHFPGIKSDLEKLKYAYAIAELTFTLTLEGETNKKLFQGLEKILGMLDSDRLRPDISFLKYAIFLISELGYEIPDRICHNCGRELGESDRICLSFEFGFFCDECCEGNRISSIFNKELFHFYNCLKTKSDCSEFRKENSRKLQHIIEKYIGYHVPDFKGISSLKIY